MRTVTDLMIKDVVTLNETDTVADARALMRDKRIRHIPIIGNMTKQFRGLITQRQLLRHAFETVSQGGAKAINEKETNVALESIMDTNIQTISPDTPLVEAARFFVEKKHGCLPVITNGKVVGILTPPDLVKLCVQFLENEQQT